MIFHDGTLQYASLVWPSLIPKMLLIHCADLLPFMSHFTNVVGSGFLTVSLQNGTLKSRNLVLISIR